MNKNESWQSKLLFRQRIALALFGLFLFFASLEVSLRLGGFILLSIQQHRNAQSLKQKGAYRILCLGESTTQKQYPRFLEKTLNQRNMGVRFSVIDKGLGGTNSPAILSQVEPYLDKYHPDMVVAMMGINDWGGHIPFEIATTSKGMLLIRSFRTYKLIRLLWLRILTKAGEIGVYKPNEDRQYSQETQTYFKRIWLNKTYAEPISPECSVKQALELNPKNDNAYTGLGWFYRGQGKCSEAENLFKQALELNPKNDNAYVGLGWLYREQGKCSEAENLFKQALELNPKNDNAYTGLGWLYREQDKCSEAENLFKQALELNPKNDNAYTGLGWLYREQGKFSEIEDLFKQAIEFNPKNYDAYTGLGWIYQNQGKFSKVEDLFKQAIELNPDNDSAYGAISVYYEEIGKPELAKEYAGKANKLRLGYYVPVTVNSYRKLKQILDKKGIRLVCVQYPMRSIAALKKIFDKDAGVIFVDNESVFKEALKKASYKEYFRDMFGGDFGHCTVKGNQLLAQNIANTILKEFFGK